MHTMCVHLRAAMSCPACPQDELDAKEALARYVCSSGWCRKEYDSLEAHYLIRPDGEMHCEQCEARVEQVQGGRRAAQGKGRA